MTAATHAAPHDTHATPHDTHAMPATPHATPSHSATGATTHTTTSAKTNFQKYIVPAVVVALFVIIVLPVAWAILSQIFGTTPLKIGLAVGIVVGGQLLVHRYKSTNLGWTGWFLTVVGGLGSLWLILELFIGGLALVTSGTPVNTNPETPTALVVPLIWWQLGLTIVGMLAGEALVKHTTLHMAGRLLQFSAIAFGLYAIYSVIDPTFWSIWLPNFWAQVQTFDPMKVLGEIWATIKGPHPYGLYFVAIAAPLALLWLLFNPKWRPILIIIGLIALLFWVYRDAVPAEVKTWIETTYQEWREKADEPAVPETPKIVEIPDAPPIDDIPAPSDYPTYGNGEEVEMPIGGVRTFYLIGVVEIINENYGYCTSVNNDTLEQWDERDGRSVFIKTSNGKKMLVTVRIKPARDCGDNPIEEEFYLD